MPVIRRLYALRWWMISLITIGTILNYLTRATLLADDAGALLDVGKFQLLSRDPDASAGTLEASLRLDGTLEASRYFLALARIAEGRVAEARDLLSRIPRTDAYAQAAAKLLATLPPRRPVP